MFWRVNYGESLLKVKRVGGMGNRWTFGSALQPFERPELSGIIF